LLCICCGINSCAPGSLSLDEKSILKKLGHIILKGKTGHFQMILVRRCCAFTHFHGLKKYDFPTPKVILLPIVPIARAGSHFKHNSSKVQEYQQKLKRIFLWKIF
jgi:hypothetical protein